ncbi:MAG: extracellular solute-binding protein, partial [Candidatus Merdivicinus sp.]
MKRVFVFVLALAALVTLFGGCAGKDSDTVVIYSSMEDYRNEELAKQLKEKFPDIDSKVQQISTGNAAAKIKAEGTKTEADIVLGLETASYLSIADNFASLNGFTPQKYLPEAHIDDDRAFIWEKFEGGFIINTKVLAEKGLEEPKTYEDLLKPEYKGLIVMPDPKTSGTGYMFLNTWVNTMGEDEAFHYVDKLQENIKQFTESGSGPIKALNQGEAAIGLGMLFQAAEQITQGSPLKIVQPEDGCPYNTTIFGIISGKETAENVKKVIEFLNNEFFTYDKTYY